MTLPDRPRLRDHVHLRWDAVRGAWALLSPERVSFPDPIALDILRRLDGHQTRRALAADLAAAYHAPASQVAADVDAFLTDLARAGLLAP